MFGSHAAFNPTSVIHLSVVNACCLCCQRLEPALTGCGESVLQLVSGQAVGTLFDLEESRYMQERMEAEAQHQGVLSTVYRVLSTVYCVLLYCLLLYCLLSTVLLPTRNHLLCTVHCPLSVVYHPLPSVIPSPAVLHLDSRMTLSPSPGALCTTPAQPAQL